MVMDNSVIHKTEKFSQSPARSKKHRTMTPSPSKSVKSEVRSPSCSQETAKRKLSFDNSQTSVDEGSAKKSKKHRKKKKSNFNSNSVLQESCAEEPSSSHHNSSRSDRGKLGNVSSLSEALEDINDQADLEFDEQIAEKMSSIKIVIPQEEHPSRRFENRISKTPSKEVIEKIEASGMVMRVGKYNNKEDNIIRTNWNEFAKIYEFDDPHVFCNKQYWNHLPLIEKKNFVQFLANGLSNRYLSAVYGRFLSLFEERKRGNFSAQEDDLIKTEIASKSKKSYAKLSKVLSRTRSSIYKRAKHLASEISGSDVQKGNLDYSQRVLEAIISATECNSMKGLQKAQMSSKVWIQAEKISFIPRDTIRHFWESKLSSELFARKPLYRSKIRLQILDILDSEKARHWQDVQWNKLAADFHGISGLFLYYKFKSLVRAEVPEEKRHSLRKCVKHLKNHWKPNVTDRKDREYPRLKYKNGELIEYLSTNVGSD